MTRDIIYCRPASQPFSNVDFKNFTPVSTSIVILYLVSWLASQPLSNVAFHTCVHRHRNTLVRWPASQPLSNVTFKNFSHVSTYMVIFYVVCWPAFQPLTNVASERVQTCYSAQILHTPMTILSFGLDIMARDIIVHWPACCLSALKQCRF